MPGISGYIILAALFAVLAVSPIASTWVVKAAGDRIETAVDKLIEFKTDRKTKMATFETRWCSKHGNAFAEQIVITPRGPDGALAVHVKDVKELMEAFPPAEKPETGTIPNTEDE